MVTAAADGGGGGGDGFPHTSYYDPGDVNGGSGQTGGSPDAPSVLDSVLSDMSSIGIASNLIGMGSSAYDKVHDAVKPTDPQSIIDSGHAYGKVSTAAYQHGAQVDKALGHLGTWSGDDADKAKKIITGLSATYYSLGNNSANMSSALVNMGQNLDSVRKTYSKDQSTWGNISNAFTGSDDRGAVSAYQGLMQNFGQNVQHVVPKQVPTEIKKNGTQANVTPPPPPPKTGGPNGAPSVGGPGSTPHLSGPTPTHIQQPTQPGPGTTHHPHPPVYPRPPIDPIDPTDPTNPPYNNPPGTNPPGGISPYQGGGGGIGLPGGSGGLDTGGSLSGLDGGGAGGGLGAGDLGAGAGGAGTGGVSGLGAGVGGGLGAGAGGAGAGGAGAGAAGGVNGAGAGAGGRGMMMPMHGAGDKDEDERERSTWLNEDEDVWGTEDDVPGVIR